MSCQIIKTRKKQEGKKCRAGKTATKVRGMECVRMYKSVKNPALLLFFATFVVFRAGKVFGATGTEVATQGGREKWAGPGGSGACKVQKLVEYDRALKMP